MYVTYIIIITYKYTLSFKLCPTDLIELHKSFANRSL